VLCCRGCRVVLVVTVVHVCRCSVGMLCFVGVEYVCVVVM